MPKSKRNKIVHLTKVKKKGKDHKDDLVKTLEGYLDKFKYAFFFDIDSTKGDRLMELRLRLKKHGNIFAGRNSIVSLTLKNFGAKTETNYRNLLKHISGHLALFFTNLECDNLASLLETELPEFRDKLLGFANLKESKNQDVIDSDNDETGDIDEEQQTAGWKRVVFEPIKKAKKRRLAPNKSGSTRESIKSS